MNIKSMTLPEMQAALKELGQPAFRAKLAGIPGVVISRAREILNELESEGGKVPAPVQKEPDDQVSWLDMQGQQVIAALNAITVETLTPIEAMNELYKLKKMLN